MKLGVLAGGGPFPRRLADAWRARGGETFVVCLRDFADPALFEGHPCMVERAGAAGAILARLRAEGVTHLVLAGRAKRPSFATLWPDAWTARQIARLGRAVLGGDDALLRAIAEVLREEGFTLLAPQEVLGDALAEEGLLAGPAPDETAEADIARGMAVLAALSPVDVGQAVVVQQGLVLGIEAIEGTDALLARAGAHRREGPGGVLVKLPKLGQDMRLDPPVIGPTTVEGAAAAGLRGLCIAAGGTAIADRAATLARAGTLGLFIVARRWGAQGETP
ncbi:LpxI family protein [Rubritepida flocculans]|uniref:LpxI family protein n=1 Tax=Rubritepida flocculans TaxID=182403 RepID=UPI000411CA55|nr:UDP-2,3-diacylglucosamine diphosphatase LpxI [Rubritepida flocculans]